MVKFLLKTVLSAGLKKHIMKPTFKAMAVILKPMRQLKPKTARLNKAKSIQPTIDAGEVKLIPGSTPSGKKPRKKKMLTQAAKQPVIPAEAVLRTPPIVKVLKKT